VHNHPIDDLCLVVCLGEERSGFSEIGSNSDQRLDQNVLRNLLSQSEMMVYGIPKWTHTHSNKILEVSADVIFFLQAVRMAIFENQSTTTNIQSFPFLVDGRTNM
jgi:hypothetical protein